MDPVISSDFSFLSKTVFSLFPSLLSSSLHRVISEGLKPDNFPTLG